MVNLPELRRMDESVVLHRKYLLRNVLLIENFGSSSRSLSFDLYITFLFLFFPPCIALSKFKFVKVAGSLVSFACCNGLLSCMSLLLPDRLIKKHLRWRVVA